MIKTYFKNLINSCLAGALLLNIGTNSFITDLWDDIVERTIDISLAGTVEPLKIDVIATGYSSEPSQTDDTPFHTANGKKVYDGLVAANFLEFGTEIKIPELYDDKVFKVDDRMNRRYTRELKKDHRIDIWFKKTSDARKFGQKKIEIIVLN
ncbi:MAG: hypothetical protein AAB847_00820 [Patescibacteria group bacterium]